MSRLYQDIQFFVRYFPVWQWVLRHEIIRFFCYYRASTVNEISHGLTLLCFLSKRWISTTKGTEKTNLSREILVHILPLSMTVNPRQHNLITQYLLKIGKQCCPLLYEKKVHVVAAKHNIYQQSSSFQVHRCVFEMIS